MLYRTPFYAALLSYLTYLAFIAAFGASAAHAAPPAVEPALLQRLSQAIMHCVEQPYGLNRHTGNRIQGPLRSHCNEVTISRDRAVVTLENRAYTVLVKDSELSDGGDLNDLFMQYDSREDQEVMLASNLLAFGDPALSVLLLTGHKTEELPQVFDPKLSE